MGFLRQKGLISGFLELKYFKNSQSPQRYENYHTMHNINNINTMVMYRTIRYAI